MGFFRQEYWSGLPFLSPGDGPRPGTEPGSPALQADSLPAEPQGKSSIRVTLCDPVDGSPPGSPSLGFSGREHWSGLPFPSPGDLPNPGIELRSPALQADTLSSELPGKRGSVIFHDPLEEGMATHSSILAWRLPWTQEPGGLQSLKLQSIRHD